MLSHGRLNALWSEFGHGGESLNVFTGDVYLDIFPTCLQQQSFLNDPARTRLRPIPFAEAGAQVPGWVGTTDRPLVYLTLGTVVGVDEVLRPAIDGLATLDADVLLALGSAAGTELGSLPDNVHIEPFVNQAAWHPGASLRTFWAASTVGAAACTLPQSGHGCPSVRGW